MDSGESIIAACFRHSCHGVNSTIRQLVNFLATILRVKIEALWRRPPFPAAVALWLLVACGKSAMPQAEPNSRPKAPQVRVHYLNVCNPSEAESKELAAALARVPGKPVFTLDYEVARGRSTMPGEGSTAAAGWVRVRREFPSDSPFLNAQYSLSSDDSGMVETVVFRLREPKDLMQVSLEARVSAGMASPAAVILADTPSSRVKLERFGKGSIALARCEADQSTYEPIFRSASAIMARYRDALGLRTMFRADIARLPAGKRPKRAGSSE